MFNRQTILHNDTDATFTDTQVPTHLHALNWPFALCQSAGQDLRIAVNGVNVPYWIASWDATNKAAILFAKFPMIAPRDTTVIFSAGDNTLPAASSYDATMQPGATDADVYARFSFNEGSGLSVHSTVGSWTGTLSGITWGGAPGGGFGDAQVAPTFAAGNYASFDGISNIMSVPDLLATAGNIPPEGTITCWMRQPAINPLNATFLAVQRYGTQTIRFYATGNNRSGVSLVTGALSGTNVLTMGDIPLALPSGVIDNVWRFYAISWGQRGLEYRIDGKFMGVIADQQCGPQILGQTTDPSSGLPVATLSVGGLYDPRSGQSNSFAKFDIAELCIHQRQLSATEINQMRFRMKVHNIRSAADGNVIGYGRLHRVGLVVNPLVLGTAFNDLSFEEPNVVKEASTGKATMYVRAGIHVDNTSNGTRICRLESFDGKKWDTLTTVLGKGTGGEAGVAAGPSIFDDPKTGTRFLYYNTLSFSLFKYATSTDGGHTFASGGNVNLNGWPLASSIGNSHVIFDGTNYILYIESDAAGATWKTYRGVGSTPTSFVVSTTPVSGLPAKNGVSGGPMTYQDSTGLVHIFTHDDIPSVCYHRISVDRQNALWSPYDQWNDIETREVAQITAQQGNQIADPDVKLLTLADGVQRTYAYCDALASNAGGITLFTYDGKPEDLFKPQIWIDIEGITGSALRTVQVTQRNIVAA